MCALAALWNIIAGCELAVFSMWLSGSETVHTSWHLGESTAKEESITYSVQGNLCVIYKAGKINDRLPRSRLTLGLALLFKTYLYAVGFLLLVVALAAF